MPLPTDHCRSLSTAILVPAAFVAVGCAWAFVSGAYLSSHQGSPTALAGVGTEVAVALLAVLGGVLLHLVLRGPSAARPAAAQRRSPADDQGTLRPAIVFVAAGSIIALGGYLLYRAQAERLRADRGAELQLLVDLKSDQIAAWRDNLLLEAESNAKFLASLSEVHDNLRHPGGTISHVQEHLERLNEAGRLHAISIFDAHGRTIAHAGAPIWRGAAVQSLIGTAVQAGAARVAGPHPTSGPASEFAVDVAVPFRFLADVDQVVEAVLVLRADASRELLPLISSSRTGLKTFQTTILRNDGYSVVSLGGLDDPAGGPGNLQLPLDQDRYVAVRIVLGATGVVEGLDSHGVETLAASRPIPGTDWFMAAKVSRAETYLPLARAARVAGLLVTAALLGAGLLVGYWWRQERYRLVLRMHDAEQRASAMLQNFGSVTQHVNDLVLLLDEDFCIVDVNARVTETLGYSRGDLVGRHYTFLHPDEPDAAASVSRAELQVREQGSARYEATYVCRDGARRQFEVSGRSFEVQQRRYVQSIARDITERLAQERRYAELAHERDRALRQLKLQFDNLTHGCVVTTPELEVLQVNPAFERMFGHKAADLAGRDVFEVLLPAEARPFVAERLARLRRGDGPIREEHPMLTASGTRLTCRGSYTPLLDEQGQVAGLMAIVEDISERRATERALRERTAEFRALTEAAPVGILQLDARGRAVYHNSKWCQITGHTAEEVLNGDWRGSIHPDDRARIAAMVKANLASGRFRAEARCVTPQGVVRWVLGQGVTMHGADGRISGFLGTIIDITDRVVAEAALRESHVDLERRIDERTRDLVMARDRAEQADRVKSQFLATMSHELRTPLNSIMGFTDVLLQGMSGPLSEPQRHQLGIVRDSATHLLDLINDVLDMSRIEAGQLALEVAEFDAVDLLRRRMASFEPAAAARGLRLHLHAEPEACVACADPRRVAQIVGNLLSNALKFTDAGSVTVSLCCDGDAVRIAVTDTGPGIAPDHLPNLFAPFRQFRSPTGRLHDGTGLGLAISRNLARAMGGDVLVTTEVGRGSTFTLVLPAPAAADA